ncbi:MAG: site-2 protease family protein [Pontixanthobacter sp.]
MSEFMIMAAVIVPGLVIAIVFHEVAHGWVALALGDPTAKERRRLSFNPIRHADPVGTLVVPGLLAIAQGPIFGWAKPVPVRKDRLNNPRYGMMAVGAAGPAMNFLLALVGAIVLGGLVGTTEGPSSDGFATFLDGIQYFILINIFLALFNLLPIPPFDGSHIVEGLLPPKLAKRYGSLRSLGMFLLLPIVALSWFAPELGIVENVVLPPVSWVMNHYIAVAEWVAGLF